MPSLRAPCDEVAPGVWRCRFNPDGYGPSHDLAKIDALHKGMLLVIESAARKFAAAEKK